MASLKIVTFNIRNVLYEDGENGFVHRVGMIFDKIIKEAPDIIAFQEIWYPHLVMLRRLLTDYDFYGQRRNEDFRGEGLYVAVKKEKLELLAYETFWISPTPYVPGSRYPIQSDCPRICNMLKLRHGESGKIFRVLNIHLDHISDSARIEGIKCVTGMLREYNSKHEVPAFILGDFNSYPESETMRYCRALEAPALSDLTSDIPVTSHGFGREAVKIDYILGTHGIKNALVSAGIWDDVHSGIYLSDHYPVFAILDTDKF